LTPFDIVHSRLERGASLEIRSSFFAFQDKIPRESKAGGAAAPTRKAETRRKLLGEKFFIDTYEYRELLANGETR
jgi:hypothetical protein